MGTQIQKAISDRQTSSLYSLVLFPVSEGLGLGSECSGWE